MIQISIFAETYAGTGTYTADRYDIALLYLEQFDYDLDAAVEAFKDDERWEQEHPLVGSANGSAGKRHTVGKRRFLGSR